MQDAVGLELQKLLDNGNYVLTMPTSKKVKLLTYLLKKTLKVWLVELKLSLTQKNFLID